MYSNTTDIITASVNPCGKLLATVRIMSMMITFIIHLFLIVLSSYRLTVAHKVYILL